MSNDLDNMQLEELINLMRIHEITENFKGKKVKK
jgi:hypothetical protein